MVKQLADFHPSLFVGSLCSFSQEMLELGKDLFDGVKVGRIWRQKQQFCANAADSLANGRPLMAAEIIHDDDIACGQCRHKALLDIGGENIAVHGTVDHLRGIDPIMAQRGNEGHRFPMAIGRMGA